MQALNPHGDVLEAPIFSVCIPFGVLKVLISVVSEATKASAHIVPWSCVAACYLSPVHLMWKRQWLPGSGQWRWRKSGGWGGRGRKWIQSEFEACSRRRNPTGCHRALRPPAVWVVREDRPPWLGLRIPVEGPGPQWWLGGVELLL